MADLHSRVRLTLSLIAVALVATLSSHAVATATNGRQQAAVATPAEQLAPIPNDAEIESFLRQAKVGKTRGTGKGVTDSIRATMSDGRLTHDAHIQTIDEYKREFRTQKGTELDFRDSWMFNVAAYKLDRLLGLNMVPVSVAGNTVRSPPPSRGGWTTF